MHPQFRKFISWKVESWPSIGSNSEACCTMARQVRRDSYLYMLPRSNFWPKVTRWHCGSFNRMLSNLTSTCFGQILNIINQRVSIACMKLLKGRLESIPSRSKQSRTLSKQSSLNPCIAMVPFFDGVVAKEFAMASYLIPNLQHRIWAMKLVLCDTLRQQTHVPSERDHLFAGSLMLTSLAKKFEMRTIIPKAKIKAPAFASATEPGKILPAAAHKSIKA